ncbi:MAG: DUF192 domain-containing protein [bacterium]|nr:DUF192 domain-containing protein [bacterium]
MLENIILLIAIGAFCTGIFFLWKLLFAKNISRKSVATLTVNKHVYQVEIAKTFLQRANGLMRRDLLLENHGMIFQFDNKITPAFTMQGVRFPLDIIWIANDRIVDIAKNLQPDTGMLASAYRPTMPVEMVLELNGGVSDKDGIKIGDSVILKV